MARERPDLADPDKCPHEHFKTLKRKLFEYLAVMSTGGNGDLPGHITSQHVEGAPTLCAKTRPMAILEKTIPSYEGNVFELCTFISVLHE